MCLRRIVYVLSCQQSAGETGGRRLVVYVLVLKILLWTQDEAMAGFLVLVPAVEVRPGVARPVSRFQWACTGTNRRILLPLTRVWGIDEQREEGKKKGRSTCANCQVFRVTTAKTTGLLRFSVAPMTVLQSHNRLSFTLSPFQKRRRREGKHKATHSELHKG